MKTMAVLLMRLQNIEPSTGARVVLFLYVALLAILIFIARSELDPLQLSDNPSREQLDHSIQSFETLIHYLFVFTVLQAVLISAYFVLIANKSIKSGRFPPQGTRVVKRTRIVQGKKAMQSAFACYFIALIAWLLVLIPAYLQWVLNEFT